MSSPTNRPLFSASILELRDLVEGDHNQIDPEVMQSVRDELAFRSVPKAKKLAKELGCQHKVVPSNADVLRYQAEQRDTLDSIGHGIDEVDAGLRRVGQCLGDPAAFDHDWTPSSSSVEVL